MAMTLQQKNQCDSVTPFLSLFYIPQNFDQSADCVAHFVTACAAAIGSEHLVLLHKIREPLKIQSAPSEGWPGRRLR
jgi:hypothetical protein